jgi:protein ImuA
MPHAGRDIVLSELRERIERLEQGGRKRAVLPFGVAAIDHNLPGNGLALGAVHDFMEAGAPSEHSACAALFAAGILARLKGPVLWSRSSSGPLWPRRSSRSAMTRCNRAGTTSL